MDQPAVSGTVPVRSNAVRLVVIGIAGVVLGVLTAYAQGWLPDAVAPLANSSGSWALIAYFLAFAAIGAWTASAAGCIALLALLFGYIAGAMARDYSSSTAMIVFWLLAAAIAGPILGLAAHWVRRGRPSFAAVGAGVMGGILIGEGIYGLTYIANSTAPAYWWAQIVVGALIWVVAVALRVRRLRDIILGLVVTAVVAGAFVVVYGLNLLRLF